MTPALSSAEHEILQLRANMQQLHSMFVASQAQVARGGSDRRQAKPPPMSKFQGSVGSEVDAWIEELNIQFEFLGAREFPDDASRIAYAAAFMSVTVRQWWATENQMAVVTWDLFVQRLHARFRPLMAADTARQRLRTVKQKGSVSQYCTVFQNLMALIPDMAAPDQVLSFVEGLSHPSVKERVREKSPKTLHAAMDAAMHADSIFAGGRPSAPYSYRPSGNTSSSFVPMDVNQVGLDSVEDSQFALSGTSGLPDALSAVMAKLEALDMRINALSQGSGGAGVHPMRKGGNGDRVPGLKLGDIDRLRAENRCFRCHKTGHMKHECPKADF